MATPTASTFVLLEDGSGQTVVVSPKDRDKFCMKVDEAVRACKMLTRGYSFVRQIGDLQERLALWLEQHREQIHAAYLTIRSEGLLFLVVQKEVRCDQGLVAALTDLDIEIACNDQLDEFDLEVLSLPFTSHDSLDAFMSSGQVIRDAIKDSAPSGRSGESESAQLSGCSG